MRRYAFTLFAILALWMVGDHAILAQRPIDNCGPRFRRDPAAANRAREAKKAYLRSQGMPERFLHLLDREECVGCIEMASDAFHIMVVYNDDEHAPKSSGGRWTQITFKWDPQSERQVRDQLAAGTIKAFYILNTATRCQCCPDFNDDSKTNESYADWNPELGVHMSHVIAFDDKSDLGPLPPDLENPPDGWINDVPNIEQFTKPRKRQVHVVCPACRDLADQWNSAADTLDSLWDRKLTLLKGISITENAMGHRANEISRLEYQQLFSTRTDARQQQIEALKKINEQQQEGIAYDQRRLEEVDRDIAETEARMAALMKQILECEKRCLTGAATTTPPANIPPVTEKPASAPAPPPPAPLPPITVGTADGQVPTARCRECLSLEDSLREMMDELAGARGRLAAINAQIRDHEAKCEKVVKDHDDLIEKIKEFQGAISAEGKAAFLESIRAVEPCLDRAGMLEAERRVAESSVKALTETMAGLEEKLSACNKTCATGTTGNTPPAVEARTFTAACPQCQGIVDALNRELADLARVRAALQQAEFDEAALAEEVKARPADAAAAGRLETATKTVRELNRREFSIETIVKSLEFQLSECNQRCTTGAAPRETTTGDTPVTTGPPPETAGTPPETAGTPPATTSPPPPADPSATAACPACEGLASRIRGTLASLAKGRERIEFLESQIRITEREIALAQQKGAVPADLTNTLQELRRELMGIGSGTSDQAARLRAMLEELARCNKACATGTTGTPGGAPTETTTGDTPVTTGTPPSTTGTPPPADPGVTAACPACEYLASRVRETLASLAKARERIEFLQSQIRITEREIALEQQKGAVPADLTNTLQELRRQLMGIGSGASDQATRLRPMLEELARCNKACTTGTTGTTPTTTVAIDPVRAACPACEALANSIRDGRANLAKLQQQMDEIAAKYRATEQQVSAARQQGVTDLGPLMKIIDNLRADGAFVGTRMDQQRQQLKQMEADLEACNRSCFTATETINPPDAPPIDFFNPGTWGPAVTVDINGRVQVKFVDGIDSAMGSGMVIEAAEQKDVRRWFNPLGLLTRHVRDHVDRWRGSMGPRPLVRPRDLELIETYSAGAQLGLPKGVHVLLTDRGGSTGKTMTLQILNLSGRPALLRSMPFAVEPIAQQAQERVQQAFGRLAKAAPVNVDLFGYCVEFLKAPPSPNQIFRLAPKAVQDKFAPMSKVLQAAARIQKEGLLNPDSNPATYTDAIKQWALWTVEQNLNESRFTQAFLGHTKKNVEAAGQQWPKDGDATVRKVAPNRWRDIAKILSGAGLPVPQ